LFAKQAALTDDHEIKELLGQLPDALRKSLTFHPEIAADSSLGISADRPPSLAVSIFRGPRPSPNPNPSARPVLALVRGVLYAFEPHHATIRWVRRVGVDTTALPVWLPPTEATPATVLVCSSEAGGLLALDALDGSVRWVQDLQEPCLGPPVLLG